MCSCRTMKRRNLKNRYVRNALCSGACVLFGLVLATFFSVLDGSEPLLNGYHASAQVFLIGSVLLPFILMINSNSFVRNQ